MTDLFDIAIAEKLAGGGGGGGSSDFSTATVTVVNGISATFTWGMPIATSDTEQGFYIAQSDTYIEANSTSSFTAILFKGQCLLYAPQGNTLTISGDIEDDGDDYYIITGDCTITIS